MPCRIISLVLLGDRRAFIVTAQDTESSDSTARQTAEAAAGRLNQVLTETHEERNLRFLLTAGGLSAAATLLYMGLLRALAWLRRRVLVRLPLHMQRHSRVLHVGQSPLFDTRHFYAMSRRLLGVLHWLMVILLTYEWLTFVLQQFPYTRPRAESLNQYLFTLARYVLDAVVSAIPTAATRRAAVAAARQYPGRVQRTRRADHVAALSGGPRAGQDGAQRTLGHQPGAGTRRKGR